MLICKQRSESYRSIYSSCIADMESWSSPWSCCKLEKASLGSAHRVFEGLVPHPTVDRELVDGWGWGSLLPPSLLALLWRSLSDKVLIATRVAGSFSILDRASVILCIKFTFSSWRLRLCRDCWSSGFGSAVAGSSVLASAGVSLCDSEKNSWNVHNYSILIGARF